jgi:hypothetical protein
MVPSGLPVVFLPLTEAPGARRQVGTRNAGIGHGAPHAAPPAQRPGVVEREADLYPPRFHRGGPYSKDPGRGVNPTWQGPLTGEGSEWHTARPSGAMTGPPEPVDRVDTAPGVSLAVGRLLPRGLEDP